MERSGHIHIISAGERIGTTYPAIFRALPTITRTFVLADSTAFEGSSDPATGKERAAIRHAADSVREISGTLGIPFSRETIFSPVFPSARAAVMRIRRENPGARFTFDLSGGPKDLCMALFSLAPWLGAEVYIAQAHTVPQRVPLPGRDAEGLMGNVNYQTILALLLRDRGEGTEPGNYVWRSREYLYKQLASQYVPIRTKRVKTLPGDPWKAPGQPGAEGRQVPELSHGTFSDFMRVLLDCGFVARQEAGDGSQQKMYRATGAGEMAFRFYADPEANSLIRMVLEQ